MRNALLGLTGRAGMGGGGGPSKRTRQDGAPLALLLYASVLFS